MQTTRKFILSEFLSLVVPTRHDLLTGKKLLFYEKSLVYASTVLWARVYATPDGEYVTVSVSDSHGIVTTHTFRIGESPLFLRLLPVEPERITRFVNVYEGELGNYLYSSVESAKLAGSTWLVGGKNASFQIQINFIRDEHGNITLAPPQNNQYVQKI